jgi:hypothetical protein
MKLFCNNFFLHLDKIATDNDGTVYLMQSNEYQIIFYGLILKLLHILL